MIFNIKRDKNKIKCKQFNKLNEFQKLYIYKLIRTKNNPIEVNISDIFSLTREYPPSIIGQTGSSDIFVFRRTDGNRCKIWLTKKVYSDLYRNIRLKKQILKDMVVLVKR